ncbi:Zinc finger CCCH domain-containing protein 38 [Raphanus sativus]|nr:Zinc finger CCCH domain-containing protein 38 [Raphanus sativus]
MSGSGRKHVSKWDHSKEDTHHPGSIDENSGSHYRDKDPPHHVLFNADSNASRRSEEDHQHSRQDRARSRVSQNNDNSYYPKQDETRQHFSHRARRDHHAGSYDRHKTRTRDEFNKRGGDPRETRYHHSNDFRGARSSDYDDEDTEGRYRREHLQHDGVSDPRLRRQGSELTAGEKEKQRRGYDGDGEGRFRRSWEIPCKFFAAGNCRNGQHCRFSHHGGADRNQNNFYRQDNNNYHSDGDERLSKGASETKGNAGSSSWIGDMEMSPDWNYGAHNLKKTSKEEPGVGQSSKSRVDDQGSSDMYSYGDNNKPMVEKPIPDSHQNYNNSVKAYQDNHHHSVVEKAVPVQSGVTREQIDQITKISATIAQFLANGQPISQLTQTLQMPLLSQPSMATQINSVSNKGLGVSTDADGAPPVTDASQVSNVDGVQELPVAPEENRDTKTTNEEARMRTFKFALVEIVKELLKPAWKEGKMKKDGYKNIVKKVVEKVTGSMQSGNVPTTQEKIDHYLSASKPKLTKLVQAYISKVKKT